MIVADSKHSILHDATLRMKDTRSDMRASDNKGIQKGCNIWEFPKIGDPNIVPQIVGSLL